MRDTSRAYASSSYDGKTVVFYGKLDTIVTNVSLGGSRSIDHDGWTYSLNATDCSQFDSELHGKHVKLRGTPLRESFERVCAATSYEDVLKAWFAIQREFHHAFEEQCKQKHQAAATPDQQEPQPKRRKQPRRK